MSYGIGLGAFVGGMQQGMQMREKIDAGIERRANKKALGAIETDTKAAFDSQVEAGTAKPQDYDKFWMEYALPKRTAELMRQGDIPGARALQEWGQSEDALKGGRLFSSSLLKSQTGDFGGALDDAISAGKVKGYIDHGYELVSKDELRDKENNLLGFRLSIKQGDGELMEQDVGVNDVQRVVATFANPDAAWASQQAAKAAQAEKDNKRAEDTADSEAKIATELDTYAKKKQIDQQYPDQKADKDTSAKDYAAALKLRMETDLDFADKSPEERDAVVRGDLNLGTTYARDRADGQTTGIGAAAMPPAPQSAGIQMSAPQSAETQAMPQSIPQAAQSTTLGIAPAPQGQQPNLTKLMDDGVAEIRNGASAVEVRKKLGQLGVSDDQFTKHIKGLAKRPIPRQIAPQPASKQPIPASGGAADFNWGQ